MTRLSVKELETYLNRCVRCGQCRSVCPVFGVIRREGAAPRGKVYLAHEMLHARIPLSAEAEKHLSLCLGCMACSRECPTGIPVHEIVYLARSRLAAAVPAPARNLLYTRIWTSPSLLSGAVSLARLLQAGNLLGPRLTSHLPRNLLNTAALQRPARSMLGEVYQPPGPAVANITYYIGCGTNFLFPGLARQAVSVLTSLGCRVNVSKDTACCGLPHLAAGLPETAAGLLERNLGALTTAGADAVVTDCATCYSTLAGGAGSSLRVLDLNQLILSLPVNPGRFKEVPPRRVTCHDPCHLSASGGTDWPRRLLASIPGLTLTEMTGSAGCCGGGGTFMLRHQEISDALLKQKISSLNATGADTVTTCCPACMLQLSRGNPGLSVIHPVQLMSIQL